MLPKNVFQWIIHDKSQKEESSLEAIEHFSISTVEKAKGFHEKFPQYEPTPLHALDQLAKKLKVEKIWVKDESKRFGLNAFKVLGASYAMGRFLAEKLSKPITEITFEDLRSEEIQKQLGDITFTTATDGNHGRAVAWTAQQLGQKAVVYMPKGSAQKRLEAILETGAEGYITDLNYDDAVRLAAQNAEKYGWQLIQDTAWEGYEKIPLWIMQGYATIAREIEEQLQQQGVEKPTHVLLQAGVGSFAGAIQGYFAHRFGKDCPVTIVLEPEEAACIYLSALKGDGEPHAVRGDLSTIMAGLACGEPNPVGWEILRDYGDAYFSCHDYTAERGMRILANPLPGDPKIVSGESGAVGIGWMSILREEKDYEGLCRALRIDEHSKILVISTEGDTDPENYQKILWG